MSDSQDLFLLPPFYWGFLLAPPLLSPVVTAQLSELRNLFCSADYLFRRCAALTLSGIQFLRYSVSLMSVTSSPETKLTSTQNIMKGIWGGDGLSQQTGQAIWKVVIVQRESQVAARDGQNPPSSGVFWELTGCVHCLSPVRKWKSNVIVWYSVLFYCLFIIILLVFSLCLKKNTHCLYKISKNRRKKSGFVYKVKKNFWIFFGGGEMSGIEGISWHSRVKAQPVD